MTDKSEINIKSGVETSGGDVNYYLVNIENPKRLAPYVAECDDLIEALGLTFAEGNVFKSLWRSGTARMYQTLKGGHEHDVENVYDGQKIAHYGARIKAVREFQKGKRLAAIGTTPSVYTVAGLLRPVPLPDIGTTPTELTSDLDRHMAEIDSVVQQTMAGDRDPLSGVTLSDSDNDKRTYGI